MKFQNGAQIHDERQNFLSFKICIFDFYTHFFLVLFKFFLNY
jgi:hypothetical protein